METRTRTWMWAALIALAALQVYCVRELMAALLLFAVVFGAVALLGFLLYLVHLGGQRAVSALENAARSGLDASARLPSRNHQIENHPIQ
jgi:hypothetical protein